MKHSIAKGWRKRGGGVKPMNTTKEQKALKLALEALENLINQHYAETTTNDDLEKADNAITAIKEALANHIPDATKMVAQPEHEPDEVDIRSRLYQRIHELETQLALPEQEPTNLERHERNVQQLFGTQQPKEPAVAEQHKQEPVAWCVINNGELIEATLYRDYAEEILAGQIEGCGSEIAPLYTHPPVPTAKPKGDGIDEAAMFAAQHKFLEWNRQQDERLVKVAYEYGVFQKAIELYNEAAHGIKE